MDEDRSSSKRFGASLYRLQEAVRVKCSRVCNSESKTMIELNSDFPFDIRDAEQIVNLLIRVSDPGLGLPIPDRKRHLAESVCKLIDADIFLWYTMIADSQCAERLVATCTIDGGWSSSEQRYAVLKLLHDPEFGVQIRVAHQHIKPRGLCVVRRREDYIDEKTWSVVGRLWLEAGLHHTLLCIYPLSPPSLSAISFHRKKEKPPFSIRDRSIVELVFEQVGWLHRDAAKECTGKVVENLSRREKQVLTFLLDGRSNKQIAALLELSEYTVGDYIKSIFKHFEVHSRGELQAVFLVGRLKSP